MVSITPSKNAFNLTDDLYNNLIDDIEIYAAYDNNTPIPWDCSFEIKAHNFILDGTVGPSGIGHCICSIPCHCVEDFYRIEINRNLTFNELDEIQNCGWIVKN